MSSLTTTTINTMNATTDLTLMTGNSSAAAIVLATNGTMQLKANSTLNAISISATSITTNTATFTSNGNFTASGNVSAVNISASANVSAVNISASANVSAVNIAASGTVYAEIIDVASNTMYVGTSTDMANGYTYLPNGFKMNWGSMVVNTTSVATFSSAFTTNAYSVTVTPITASIYISANTINVLAVNAQAAQIRSLSTTTTARAYFIAIGT